MTLKLVRNHVRLAFVNPRPKSGFTDMSVNFNESAEFKCEVSEPDAKGKWFKDGKEVSINLY